MRKLFCDDCGCHISVGSTYYGGEPGAASAYPDGYVEALCQHCYDEERKFWSTPIYFAPDGRLMVWDWAFGWLKSSFWRLKA